MRRLPQLTKGHNCSYVLEYPQFTNFKFPPELSYYIYRSSSAYIPITLTEAWSYLNETGILSIKVAQDAIMERKTISRYLKYVIIESLGGLFLKITPK